MRKIVAEDSNGGRFYIDTVGGTYTITGALIPKDAPIVAPSWPAALKQLRAFMLNHGRVLLTFDMMPGQYVTQKGEVLK